MTSSVLDAKLNPNWEKFFMLLLIINPIFDLYTGVYLNIATNIVNMRVYDLLTPTLIVRMLILLVFALYILKLRDTKSIIYVSLIGVVFVMTAIGGFLFAEWYSLFAEITYIARFTYNIAIILVFWRVFQRINWPKEKILKYLNWVFALTSLIISGSILLAFAARMGFHTYGDRFGFRGSRGFFYSGNDVTAVLMVILPICFVTYMLMDKNLPRKQQYFYLLAPATAICALFLIGTNTAYMAIIATVLTFLINALRHKKKQQDKSRLQSFGKIMLATVVVFGVMSAISAANMWLEFRDQIAILGDGLIGRGIISLISGRDVKLAAALADYLAGNPYIWVFGVGRGSQLLTIEMDLFEVFIYYGVFGTIIMTYLYLKLGVGFLRKFTKQVDLYSVACFLAIGLTTGYLILAGHVLFTVTSGFYYALILLYAHLYLSSSPQEVKIL
jgi:hypothetical protein